MEIAVLSAIAAASIISIIIGIALLVVLKGVK